METVSCTARLEHGCSTPEIGAVEARFRAMGSDAHVLATGPDGEAHLATARRRIDELESRWSRFLPTSEVSVANRLAGTGEAIRISGDTVALLERADLAWSATGGVWNPLLGQRLAALGYDRSFDTGLATAEAVPVAAEAVGMDAIDFDPASGALSLPAGVGLDLGGIAKGFAADLVTAELLAAGAWGALVSLGGDLRVRGMSPTGLDWGVTIGEPAIGRHELTVVRLTEGGLASSTTARRRWPSGTAEQHHHLLDPATSRPADTNIVLTAAIAGSAWWAEVCATASTIDPTLELPSYAALQVDRSGQVTRTVNFSRYES